MASEPAPTSDGLNGERDDVRQRDHVRERDGGDGDGAGGGEPDEALLDAAFERALAWVSDGRPVSVEALLPDRPELRPRLHDLLDLARDVAVQRPPALPSIAGFEIVRELGRGGMGTVYVARQEPLGRTVALKVLFAADALSRNARQRFLHEARALARISHPHVVQIHQVVEQEGVCAFAMALVEGRSLAAVIEAVRDRPEAERLAWVAQALDGADLGRDRGWNAFVLRAGAEVADALAAVHAQGLVHRDVKPSNILVRRDGVALLADFGLVRDEESAGLTGTGQFIGTLLYASPEQLRGHHDGVDARTDVYSLGVTLYHALTLRLPFAETSTARMLARIETGAAPPLRKLDRALPRDLELVVAKAMDPEPARRYQDAAALAADLRNVLDLRPVTARPASLALRAKRWVQRHPTRAAAFLVGVLGLATVTVALRMQASAGARRAQITTDRLLITGLLEEVPRLLPGGSSRIAAIEQWLSQARPLQERVAEHRALHTEILARGRPLDAADAAAEQTHLERLDRDLARDRTRAEILRTAINAPGGDNALWWETHCIWVTSLTERVEASAALRSHRRTMTFAETPDARLFGLLDEILTLSVRLAAEVQRVEARLQGARRHVALEHDARATAWPQACQMAADPRAAPRYGGMLLTPQPGLVPLGPDPQSGLLEFAHLQTGDPPLRDPATGRLRITEETGLVLVLIPGGKIMVGARPPGLGDTDGTNWCDSMASIEEQPLSELTLDPFLLSKFEMTQAQWLRVTGRNPSWFAFPQEVDGRTVTGLHPVEGVTWDKTPSVLDALDLVLPTDAQWEHACRGRTSTRYWTGTGAESLEGAENIADAGSELRAGHKREDVEARVRNSERVAWDDGWLRHAPVGSFRPNPFGLFDMQGNVGEWCQEAGTPYCRWLLFPAGPGDGLRDTPAGSAEALIRGGTFRWGAWQTRSSARLRSVPDHPAFCHGVRPARKLAR